MHVLTRPLSEYLRFEFSRYYAPHVLVGEDIRVLDVTERENPLPEVGDFWMLDRSTVVLMHYEVDGTQISRELYGGDPAPFVEWQRIARFRVGSLLGVRGARGGVTFEAEQLGDSGTELASLLRDLRRQAGLSGERLAARCNMSQSKVSRIENGRTRPSLIDVEQTLRALDAPPALVAEVSALARMANTEWRNLRKLRRQAVLYDASKRFTFVLTERAVRWPVVSLLALAEQSDGGDLADGSADASCTKEGGPRWGALPSAVDRPARNASRAALADDHASPAQAPADGFALGLSRYADTVGSPAR
ncbi:helix-turn-helix domain-containing protein [Streptomyces sp. NPDC003703]|uniref:helix-turn-helix domain-containing protein n=1 Tax=Streptomyces sp. NPDC003283 TaxID=3364681 RepID=UPI0036A50B5A